MSEAKQKVNNTFDAHFCVNEFFALENICTD